MNESDWLAASYMIETGWDWKMVKWGSLWFEGAFIFRRYPGITKSRLRKIMNGLVVAIKRQRLDLVKAWENKSVKIRELDWKPNQDAWQIRALNFYHIGVCTVTLNHLFQEVRFNVPCDRRVNGSVQCVCFVPECEVHFGTEYFHFRNMFEDELVWEVSWEI